MSNLSLRIGSLFTGTGALDLAVMDVFDADVAWHSQYEPPDKKGREDTHQYAAKILARHWPTTPNLGDITKVDWQAVLDEHGPIDILTGGFPCQDVSSAGKRAGLNADSRSGLWAHFARAIHELNPRLVVIENVEGLLSAPADRGLGLDAEALDEEAEAGRILRALGAVLGDLATLGFDAEWERVGADEVGAPHRRRRVIIYAWPADADAEDLRLGQGRLPVGTGSALADARIDREDAAHADGRRREGDEERDSGQEAGQPERQRGLDPVGRGVRRATVETDCPTCLCPESFHDAGGFCAGCLHCTDPELGRPGQCPDDCPVCADEATADATGNGRHEGRPEPAGQQGRPDAAQRGSAAPADADHSGRREDVLNLRPGQPDLDWGDYEPAIRRWERILGRAAPWPTDALGRLSPVFTEWLMGLPDGWVTDTPGLTRSAMLRALGNGVVWQQAAAALRLLHARAIRDIAAAAA